MAVTTVTEATFEREVLLSELPVLIDLYADWCAPCKQLSPRVEEVARANAGKLKVVKVNVDHAPRIAQTFRAQSIPMLVLMHKRQVVDVLQGAVPKQAIDDLVAQVLGGGASGDEVQPKELLQLLKTKRVAAVDVREPGAFNRAHVPGAVNMVPTSFDSEPELRKLAALRKPLIVYDRSNGDDAKNALKKLQEVGLPGAALKGGFLAWEAEGYDIERSN